MSEEQLIIGMPAGSLADPNRGGSLIRLLEHAGFPTKGYDAGGPSSFPLMPYLVGWDGRPQEFGAQLAIGEVDIAIGGRDWVRERQLEFKYEYGQDIDMSFVSSLERGHVRIVIIARPEDAADGIDAYLKKLLSDNAVVTTYTVTLYDNQTLTGPGVDPATTPCVSPGDEVTLKKLDDDFSDSCGYFPIGDAFKDSPIYNVVEVRVVVW